MIKRCLISQLSHENQEVIVVGQIIKIEKLNNFQSFILDDSTDVAECYFDQIDCPLQIGLLVKVLAKYQSKVVYRQQIKKLYVNQFQVLQSSNEEKLYMLETIVSNKININRQKIQIELDENINSLIELFQSHRLLSLFSILLKDRSVLDTKAEENRTHFPAIFVSKNQVNVRECLELLYCYYNLIDKQSNMKIQELTKKVNQRYELYEDNLCSNEFSCFVINGFLQMNLIYEDKNDTFGLIDQRISIQEFE